MSMQLEYNYCHIILSTGECDACMTFSYEINHPEWVQVPSMEDYIGKYYDFESQKWYYEAEFINEYIPE